MQPHKLSQFTRKDATTSEATHDCSLPATKKNRRLQSKIVVIIDDHGLVVAEDLHDELVSVMHDANGKYLV